MERNFKKDVRSLDDIFAFLDEEMRELRISPEAAYAMNLAVEELFTNMVKYGVGSMDDISLSLTREENRLIIRLVDHGVGMFDPMSAEEVDTSIPLEQRKIGGLGIHLVRHVVDDVQYSYADGCSTITVVKNLEH
jgi:serine/threonine-protein kinase RsbW